MTCPPRRPSLSYLPVTTHQPVSCCACGRAIFHHWSMLKSQYTKFSTSKLGEEKIAKWRCTDVQAFFDKKRITYQGQLARLQPTGLPYISIKTCERFSHLATSDPVHSSFCIRSLPIGDKNVCSFVIYKKREFSSKAACTVFWLGMSNRPAKRMGQAFWPRERYQKHNLQSAMM